MEKTKSRSGAYGAVIVIGVFLVMFASHYPQFQLSPLAYKIIPEFKLSTVQYSAVFQAPTLVPVFLAIISGVLADRFGIKLVIGAGCALSAIGCILRLSANDYTSMFVSMLLTGFGYAVMFANFSKLMGNWFTKDNISVAMGWAMSGTTLSNFFATATTAYFPSIPSAYIFAIVLIAITVIFWFAFVKDRPKDAPPAPPAQPILSYLGYVIKKPHVWIVGLCMFGIFGGMMTSNAFLPVALKTSRGFTPGMAGIIASLNALTNLLGYIFGPTLCRKYGRMKPFIIVLSAVYGLSLAFAWLIPSIPLMFVFVLIGGMCGGSLMPILLSFPMLLPEIGPVYAGSAGGIIVTLEMGASFVVPTYIITPIAGNNYVVLLALAGACLFVTCIATLFLPELGSKATAKTQNDNAEVKHA